MLSLRTVSARRYRIEGRLPPLGGEELYRRLADRRFLPLAADEERTYGWVSADNLLVTRFDEETVLRGARAVLGVRVDRRRVSPRLLRARLDLDLEARRKGAGGGRLSRDERQQIRADLVAELRRETNPTVEVHVVVLDPARKLILALTLARGANETILRLVRDTFGVDLRPLTPWRRATEVLAGSPALERLDRLDRTDLGDAEPPPDEAGQRAALLEAEALR